jgi:hypothetical protein
VYKLKGVVTLSLFHLGYFIRNLQLLDVIHLRCASDAWANTGHVPMMPGEAFFNAARLHQVYRGVGVTDI